MTDTRSGSATDTAKDVGGTVRDRGADVAGQAAGQARDVASSATDQAKDVAGHATDQAKKVAGTAGDQARDLIGQAQTRLHDEAGTQNEKVVSGLRALSEELGSMSDHDGEAGVATDLAVRGKGYAADAADWLDGKAPGEIFDELRGLARRRPGTFLVGALVAGVVAGRLTRGGIAAAKADTGGDADTVASAPVTPTDTVGFASDTATVPSAVSAPLYETVADYPAAGGPFDDAVPHRHASQP